MNVAFAHAHKLRKSNVQKRSFRALDIFSVGIGQGY